MEYIHAQGWSDGLPVIPPTPERLERFLAHVQRDGSEIIGHYTMRNRPITVEKLAINAIMAGCLPEHLPVVIALVECLLEPTLNLHVANSSTGSLTLGFVVNGPIRHQLGMNCHGNVLGPGNRANASIGRALRLIQINVMGSIAGAGGTLPHHLPILDRSTIGHPGKYTAYHVVEDEETFPGLVPMHVSRGFEREDSVVSAFAMGNHVMLSNHSEKTPEEWIATVAHYLVGAGRLTEHGYGVLLVPPESATLFVEAGWSKQDMAKALFAASRRSAAWVKRNGWKYGGRFERGGPVEPGDEERMLGIAGSPEELHIVICGGPAGNFPSFLQTYAESFEVISRKIHLIPSALDAAFAKLRKLLQADGYDLSVDRADASGLNLRISASAEACAECLVPPAIMGIYVRDAIQHLPEWRDAPISFAYPEKRV